MARRDGCNFYGYKGPNVIPGFLEFYELSQFEAFKGFEDLFIYKFTDNLIEQCTKFTFRGCR